MNSRLKGLVIATEGIDARAVQPLIEHAAVRIRPFQAENDQQHAAYDVVLTTHHNLSGLHPHLPVLVVPSEPQETYLLDELLPMIEKSLALDFGYPLDLKNSQVAVVAAGSGKPISEVMQFIAPNLHDNLQLVEDAFHAEARDELAERIHAIRPSVKMLGAHQLAEVLQTMELKLNRRNTAWTRINGRGVIAALKELIEKVGKFKDE